MQEIYHRGHSVKLYFWDWNKSGEIQKCDMEFPFANNDDAAKNHVFTSLGSAILAAKIDLRNEISEAKSRIEYLEGCLDRVHVVNADNVKTVRMVKGI